jgi:SP family galactose:H+ symporter-like MFS transporter
MATSDSTSASRTKNEKLPRTAIMVAITAATLGIIYGYDNGNIGAAGIFFQEDWNLTDQKVEIVSSILVVGELIGALAGGWIANRFGRKSTLIWVAIGYAITCILQGFAVSADMLIVVRFFLGFTIGVSLVAVPVFIAESVAARTRGASLVAYQVAAVVGGILGYLLAASLAGLDNSINWRIMLGVAAVPAIIILPFLLRLPETARWLMMQGRRDEALKSLKLVDPYVDDQAELDDMEASLKEETGGALGEMLRRPYLRAFIFVVGLGFFVQITGINAIVVYSPRIFQAMGVDETVEIFLYSAAIQVIALIAVIISMRVVDRWGRRPILLTGISTMIVAQVILIITFATVGTEVDATWSGTQTAAGFLGLALFNIGFVFGFGALVWVYASESFPARLRALGASALLGANLFANWLIINYFITALGELGGAVSFGFFAVMSILAWVFVFKLAPETKGRELEDIRHYWENGGKWNDTKAAPKANS